MAKKRCIADAAVTDRTVQFQRHKQKGEKKRGKAQAGKVGQGKEEEAQMLRCVIYADDAGIVLYRDYPEGWSG